MQSPNDPTTEIFRKTARPLEPLPTGVSPRLRRLGGVRTVLFDVYGTLLVSSSGDVGTDAGTGRAAAVEGAWDAIGLPLPVPPDVVVRGLEEAIHRKHRAAHARGVEFPEVDIVEIWHEVLQDTLPSDSTRAASAPIDLRRLAAEYEARVNPIWPMPGMIDCVRQLHASGLLLGIISNAQFYTEHAFLALTGFTLGQLGMDASLCFFSYEYRQAKPGRGLYEKACSVLNGRGIEPSAALYVGNDMLKDILPAQEVGFRTALFAGDARSLRLREGDERIAGVEPDLVLTELRQLLQCIEGEDREIAGV